MWDVRNYRKHPSKFTNAMWWPIACWNITDGKVNLNTVVVTLFAFVSRIWWGNWQCPIASNLTILEKKIHCQWSPLVWLIHTSCLFNCSILDWMWQQKHLLKGLHWDRRSRKTFDSKAKQMKFFTAAIVYQGIVYLIFFLSILILLTYEYWVWILNRL